MTLRAEPYPVTAICSVLGLARSSFYQSSSRQDETALCEALSGLAAAYPTYGYRRLTVLLGREGWRVNRKRVQRLLRQLGLSCPVKRRTTRTTDSMHAFPRYPNLVKHHTAAHPEAVWVADITYVRLKHEFVYLAAIMDVFTRAIRGWHVSRSLDRQLMVTALQRALAQHCPCIHHSD